MQKKSTMSSLTVEHLLQRLKQPPDAVLYDYIVYNNEHFNSPIYLGLDDYVELDELYFVIQHKITKNKRIVYLSSVR